MNINWNNLVKNRTWNLQTAAIVCTVVLTFSVVSIAQRTNSDLKRNAAASTTKTTSTAKTSSKSKTTVKTTAKTAKKSTKKTTKTVAKQTPKKTNVSKVSKEKVSFTPQTTDQIFSRFMNYQQSSTVVDKDWTSVISQTQKSIKTNPNNTTATAQMLIAEGQIAYNQRDFTTAITKYKEAKKILPTSSLVNYCLAKAYLSNGQASAAEDLFKDSVEQNKDFALAYKGVGDALMAQGKQKDGLKYHKKANEIAIRQGTFVP